MPCDANPLELCGAGSRLALYQDSSATPISPDTCIPGRGRWDFQNTPLQAVPVNSAGGALAGGVTKQIYSYITNFNSQNRPQDTILTVSVRIGPLAFRFLPLMTDLFGFLKTCTNCPASFYNFALVDGMLTPQGLPGGPQVRVPPVAGSPLDFVGYPTTPFTPYAGFCAKVRPNCSFPLHVLIGKYTQPNPISPNGPFIGFPALSIAGHADKWALCTNTTAGGRVDIVYSPIATSPDYSLSGCQNVVLQMAPWYTFIGQR